MAFGSNFVLYLALVLLAIFGGTFVSGWLIEMCSLRLERVKHVRLEKPARWLWRIWGMGFVGFFLGYIVGYVGFLFSSIIYGGGGADDVLSWFWLIAVPLVGLVLFQMAYVAYGWKKYRVIDGEGDWG